VRSRRFRLLTLIALLLPAAGAGADLLPHGHAAYEEDRVAHDVAVGVGEEPCRPSAHWDATETLHHPVCAACCWVSGPKAHPIVVALLAAPRTPGLALVPPAPERAGGRTLHPARGRDPPAALLFAA